LRKSNEGYKKLPCLKSFKFIKEKIQNDLENPSYKEKGYRDVEYFQICYLRQKNVIQNKCQKRAILLETLNFRKPPVYTDQELSQFLGVKKGNLQRITSRKNCR
jgi:hypothetical protein